MRHRPWPQASIRPFVNACETQPVAFLEGIWVDPPFTFRKTSIGRLLLEAVENRAKGKGMSELGSDAEISSLLSIQVHEAWGFLETERVVYFRKALKSGKTITLTPPDPAPKLME